MGSDNKIPTLPLIFQKKVSKRVSKNNNNLAVLDIFKLNALKSLEQSDSGSELDNDKISGETKESPSGGNIPKHSRTQKKKSKRAKQTGRRNNTKAIHKTTSVRKNKAGSGMKLAERSNETQENRKERRPSETTDSIMEVATMVSEVTISDVEREAKNKSRKGKKLAPELSSPDLRRPSSAFRRKSSKAKLIKVMHKQGFNRSEMVKEEIKDRPLVDLQKHLQKMAGLSQNSLNRPKTKPSLYIGNNTTKKSDSGKKSLYSYHKTPCNQPILINKESTTTLAGLGLNRTHNENEVLPKLKHSTTPDIKVIPPGEENFNENSYHQAEDESSPNCLSQLLDRYPSEIPISAKETWTTYTKLQQQGFNVVLKTLQRGLMTPTDQRILKELFIQSQLQKGHR